MVKPTLSFDERGHQVNDLTYFVTGLTGEGEKPVGFCPVVEDFTGEGGSYYQPKTIIEDAPFRDYDWFNAFGQNLIYVKKYIDDIHSLIA